MIYIYKFRNPHCSLIKAFDHLLLIQTSTNITINWKKISQNFSSFASRRFLALKLPLWNPANLRTTYVRKILAKKQEWTLQFTLSACIGSFVNVVVWFRAAGDFLSSPLSPGASRQHGSSWLSCSHTFCLTLRDTSYRMTFSKFIFGLNL